MNKLAIILALVAVTFTVPTVASAYAIGGGHFGGGHDFGGGHGFGFRHGFGGFGGFQQRYQENNLGCQYPTKPVIVENQIVCVQTDNDAS